jgi:hypothetical protein
MANIKLIVDTMDLLYFIISLQVFSSALGCFECFLIVHCLLVFLGIYSLDVYSVTDYFSQLKLKVSAEEQTISVIEYKYPGAQRSQANYPITLTALSPIQYEIQKPPFSLWNMLWSNPMVLMMLFSLLMVVGMPYLMKNMSPEELEEIKKQSALSGGGDPMKQLSKLMGMKSGNDEEEEEEDQVTTTTPALTANKQTVPSSSSQANKRK